MGYGDAKPFGQQRCLVETPGISQLAREGMRFTDAHTIACVCIPSRVAIMTGRYPWRDATPPASMRHDLLPRAIRGGGGGPGTTLGAHPYFRVSLGPSWGAF